MTALRILNLAVWAAMVAYMLPGAWSGAFSKSARRGDPMRLACLATALVIIGFNARWLFAPANMELWQALYVLCAIVGVYIIVLAHAYGRGPRV